MSKAVASTIKLVINAGQAKPSPPVGPALGQAGLKIMDFCKDFNGKTADIKVRGEAFCLLFCGYDYVDCFRARHCHLVDHVAPYFLAA